MHCAHVAACSCLHTCINIYVKGGCDAPLCPLPLPTSTPNNVLCDAGWAWSGPTGAWRVPLRPGPSCSPAPWWMPLSWNAERQHQAWGLWGELKTLISAVIGGNWKLSVPLGFSGGPRVERRLVTWLLEMVVVLYHTCRLKVTFTFNTCPRILFWLRNTVVNLGFTVSVPVSRVSCSHHL